MPQIIVTAAVNDVEEWLKFKAKMVSALSGVAGDGSSYVAADGSNQVASTWDVPDWRPSGRQGSFAPELAELSKRAGMIPSTMVIYIQEVVRWGRHPAPGTDPDTTGVANMLADAMLVTTVAVTDPERARHFFADQLGLTLLEETPFAYRFGAGKGTQLSVRKGQPNVGQTVAHFEVDDIEAVVRYLTSRGVEFQEYETPKTVDFIAQVGVARGAWFADHDGNVFGVREGPVPGR